MNAIMMHYPATPERVSLFNRVIAAHDPGVLVDRERIGVLAMFKKCWQAMPGPHGIVLQDDLLPCRNLMRALDAITAILPDEPVCIYDMNIHSLRVAQGIGTQWRRLQSSNWGGSVMLPTSWVANMLAWIDYALLPLNDWDDDIALCLYMRAFGRLFWHTPPLLQHLGSVSSQKHGRTYTGNQFFVGEDFDALSVDWQQGIDSAHTELYPLSSDFFRRLTPEALADYDPTQQSWRRGSVSDSLRPEGNHYGNHANLRH